MPAPPVRTRKQLALFALALAGITALSVAACGKSDDTSNHGNTEKPGTSASSTSTAPKPPPPPPPPQDEVDGLVRSVSGNTIQLTQRDRTGATVELAPSAMITELGPAQLTDVTAGSCVDVAAGPEPASPDGAITAKSVTIDPPVNGQCPPLEPPEGPHGKVTSVSGNTVTIDSTDPTGKTTPTKVTVTDATTYTRHAVTDPQAIQTGKCMAARGTKHDGVLQATIVDLEPCPPMGRPHHRFHIPNIPNIPGIPHIPDIPHLPDIPHIPHIP